MTPLHELAERVWRAVPEARPRRGNFTLVDDDDGDFVWIHEGSFARGEPHPESHIEAACWRLLPYYQWYQLDEHTVTVRLGTKCWNAPTLTEALLRAVEQRAKP